MNVSCWTRQEHVLPSSLQALNNRCVVTSCIPVLRLLELAIILLCRLDHPLEIAHPWTFQYGARITGATFLRFTASYLAWYASIQQ